MVDPRPTGQQGIPIGVDPPQDCAKAVPKAPASSGSALKGTPMAPQPAHEEPRGDPMAPHPPAVQSARCKAEEARPATGADSMAPTTGQPLSFILAQGPKMVGAEMGPKEASSHPLSTGDASLQQEEDTARTREGTGGAGGRGGGVASASCDSGSSVTCSSATSCLSKASVSGSGRDAATWQQESRQEMWGTPEAAVSTWSPAQASDETDPQFQTPPQPRIQEPPVCPGAPVKKPGLDVPHPTLGRLMRPLDFSSDEEM